MKKTKNFLAGLLIFISLAILLLYAFKKEYLLRAAKVTYLNGHSTAFLDDYKYFDNLIIQKGNQPQPWNLAKDYNSIQPTERLEKLHKEVGTVAFVIMVVITAFSTLVAVNYSRQELAVL